ncbi:MAG: hypothetical protein ACMXYE_04680 [Candidatus Woesearchaeota archaeon]
MKSHKKSQNAMEFLMMYGWSFLVIIIGIAALIAFGVFAPQRFIPDRCDASTFVCTSVSATENQIVMVLINPHSHSLYNATFSMTECSSSEFDRINPGETVIVTFNDCDAPAQSRFNGVFTAEYTKRISQEEVTRESYGMVNVHVS